jgi:dihydrofolate reductase
VAIDAKRGIAKDGVQPWKLPADEAYFEQITRKHGAVVLMGSTTYRVIGSALRGRKNFVITRDRNFKANDATVIFDLDAFFAEHTDVWVVGGAQIYTATLDRADELYVTEIEADFGCDVLYPEFSQRFTLAHRGDVRAENGLQFRYNIYRKRA